MPSKKKSASPTPDEPFRTELLKALSDSMEQRRKQYLDFVQSVQSLGPLERATEWCRYVAKNQSDFGDQEALVYLRSRGESCEPEIDAVVQQWRTSEAEVIQSAARGIPFITGRKVKHVGKTKIDPSHIAAVSTFVIRDFWSGSDYQASTIDATMLRTADWCGIGGFDGWWQRFAKESKANLLQGGIDPLPASYFLFELCRSALARNLLATTLPVVLDAILQPTTKGEPWEFFHALTKSRQLSTQFAFAATILFASATLDLKQSHKDSLRRASEAIMRGQHAEGWWSAWSFRVRPSIATTARVVHGLGVVKPRGWERAVRKACEWLWSQQTKEGSWREDASPDSVHLTIMVLDALALGAGSSVATFAAPTGSVVKATPLAQAVKPPRFDVALSFPGEIRTSVAKIADALAGELGKARVFYDMFHKAALAGPNLDVRLQRIYHRDSRLVVVFLCEAYEEKEWPSLEWRAVRDLIKQRQDKILFVRADDAEIPGVFSIDGYIDMREHSEEEVAAVILERLQLMEMEEST